MDQFSDGVEFGLDALVTLGGVLKIDGKADTQKVVQGAVVSHSIDVLCTGYRRKTSVLDAKYLSISLRTLFKS